MDNTFNPLESISREENKQIIKSVEVSIMEELRNDEPFHTSALNKFPRKLKKKLSKKGFLHRFLTPKIYIVGFGKKIKYKKRYKKSSFKNFKRTVLLPFTYNELVKKFGKDVTIKKIIKKELFTVYKTF